MNCFSAAEDTPQAIPIVALGPAELAAFAAGETAPAQRWIQTMDFQAHTQTSLVLPDADGAPRLVLAGIEDEGDPLALAHLPLSLPPGIYYLDPQRGRRVPMAKAILGWGLGAYRFDRYRTADREPARLVLEGASPIAEAYSLLKASILVRDLVNTPTQDMGPDQLEAVAVRLADAHGGQLRSIVGEALLRENFPAIHAVGRASHRAPRLVELGWGDPAHPHLVVVGKGVCFDTGGLNLKTGDGMRLMKKDMGGAAHALALAQVIMANRLPVRLTLLVPAVENAVAADAYRPGEVLRTRGGHLVEVDNTDAEGRLVLCDALAYAVESGPDLIVDFATLTGAARVALGPDLPALYSNHDELREGVLAAAREERDPVWPMPLWQPYRSYLKSSVADFTNAGASRMAGSVTAALFLQSFVPDAQPWVHYDLYAWNESDRPGRPCGGEAQGLRGTWRYLARRYRT
ncbi:MAG TPA: leucyl aminopeptidase family protein [Xanthomonadaceae bacterium]|nr:leucyl aminopeptidase family protein [Xanthomonadaceae bacterium]